MALDSCGFSELDERALLLRQVDRQWNVGTHQRCAAPTGTGARRASSRTNSRQDSQSVKTTELGGERGYDAEKKVNGRKRTLLVDTLGLVMRVLVHTADIQDSEGAEWLFAHFRREFLTLELI